MVARPINGLALCAGVGAIELGLRLALGERHHTVGYVERESFAASVLVARMEDSSLGRAPIWDDLGSFDGRPWRGRVDLISAGFPCQPFSNAGHRRGLDDDRWLWPQVDRVVGEVEPEFVFLENVPQLAKHGLEHVLGDLAARGFDAEWSTLGANDLGASHRRKRLWVLAYRDGARLEGVGWQDAGEVRDVHRPSGPAVADTEGAPWGAGLPTGEAAPCGVGVGEPCHLCGAVADPGGEGHGTESSGGEGGEAAYPRRATDVDHLARCAGEDVADAARAGLQGCHPFEGVQLARNGERPSDLWPPLPDDADGWAMSDGPQPSVCRMVDGMAHRLDRLHAIGNGVVPLVAAAAFLGLARRAGILVEEDTSSPLAARTG